jgi:hypothetical protein
MYTKRSFTFFYVRLTFPLPEILKPIGKIEPFTSNQRASYPPHTGGDIWTCPHFAPSAHLGFELLQTSPDCSTWSSASVSIFASQRSGAD